MLSSPNFSREGDWASKIWILNLPSFVGLVGPGETWFTFVFIHLSHKNANLGLQMSGWGLESHFILYLEGTYLTTHQFFSNTPIQKYDSYFRIFFQRKRVINNHALLCNIQIILTTVETQNTWSLISSLNSSFHKVHTQSALASHCYI